MQQITAHAASNCSCLLLKVIPILIVALHRETTIIAAIIDLYCILCQLVQDSPAPLEVFLSPGS